MAEEFNTEGMLDMYLFENEQLLEQLQETVLEQKDSDCFDEDSINEIFRAMHTIKGSSGIMMYCICTSLLDFHGHCEIKYTVFSYMCRHVTPPIIIQSRCLFLIIYN